MARATPAVEISRVVFAPCACVPPPLPRRNRPVHLPLTSQSVAALALFGRLGFRVTRFETCSAFTSLCDPHARYATHLSAMTGARATPWSSAIKEPEVDVNLYAEVATKSQPPSRRRSRVASTAGRRARYGSGDLTT